MHLKMGSWRTEWNPLETDVMTSQTCVDRQEAEMSCGWQGYWWGALGLVSPAHLTSKTINN